VTIKCSVYVAVSLDGFIARDDGSVDWLDTANAAMPPGEDCGFKAFFATVDTLVMGRKTFEQVLAWGKWHYGDTPVVVLSRRSASLPAGPPDTVTLSQESPAALVARLAGEGVKHVYVDGGLTIQGFLAQGLIDELTVTVIPILLGTGIPLFGPLPRDVALAHVETRVFGFGLVQHKYRVCTAD